MLLNFYSTFFLSLAVISLLIFRNGFIRERLLSSITRFAVKIFKSSSREISKFALIRIGLGLIVAVRGAYIIFYLSPGDIANPEVMIVAWLNLISGIFLATGTFTQYSILYLVLFQWQFGDRILTSMTLGNDVGAMLAVMLFISNCGRYLSFDSLLIKKLEKTGVGKYLLYYHSQPTEKTLSLAKFCALFSYWLLCVYSLSMHLNEPAWMSGNAGPWLLSNNFMSVYYQGFSSLFLLSETSVWLAKLSLWMMLPWYFLIMPFVILGGWYKRYIIIWGILFFILSKFFLQLGWLAEIEFLFWAAIFWTYRGIAKPQSLEVAYDDKCNLCDRTIQFVKLVDIFDRVKLRPVSFNPEWLKEKNIPQDNALFDLHGFDKKTNEIKKGYDFYITLTKNLALIWPLFPILILGKYLKIGPTIYRWVALRRIKMFGVCQMPSKKKMVRSLEVIRGAPSQEKTVSILVCHIIFLGLFYLISIPAPYIGYDGLSSSFSRAAHMYGISPINVFNEKDLRLAENWFTLHEIKKDNTEQLLPILDYDGSRLAFHDSDRVYFGNTLRYRRGAIDKKHCLYDEYIHTLRNLADIYLRVNDNEGNGTRFKYTQYFKPIADGDLLNRNIFSDIEKTKKLCQKEFLVN